MHLWLRCLSIACLPATWCLPAVKLLKSGKLDRSMSAAREEAKSVMFSVFEDALKRTGVKPREVDFLIVNCSLFVPTPSLSAMIHSEYGLRTDCRTFNLGGMGCSASLIALDLAKSLLSSHPGSRVVIVSTENLTQQLYLGEKRSMMVQNMLFRCGGAAVVLSNRVTDGFRAKYKLLHTQRTQTSDEEALESVFQCEDEVSNMGVRLSKDVPKIAGKALKHNLTSIGPYVLPIREQAAVVFTEIQRFLQPRLNQLGEATGIEFLKALPRPRPYIPDFKTGLEHFCIHAGGRAVIDGVGENLRLRPEQTVPSRATLHDFGNTSSSSVWYELRFCEQETPRWVGEGAGKPIVAGERVIQVAFGSGFHCNSAVWLRMR
jgi:3-ketoacyl-CoA synthase